MIVHPKDAETMICLDRTDAEDTLASVRLNKCRAIVLLHSMFTRQV